MAKETDRVSTTNEGRADERALSTRMLASTPLAVRNAVFAAFGLVRKGTYGPRATTPARRTPTPFRVLGALLASLTAVVAVLLVATGVGSAAPKSVVTSFGFTSTTPALGGGFSNVGGTAVNQTSGDVYVVDRGNHRIQQFTAAGTFVRAWGQDVDTAAGSGFEVCTVAANCKVGITTAQTGGALNAPQTIAIDQADGAVYVTDQGNRRVQKFTSAGAFVWAAGWDVVSTGGTGDSGGGTFETCTVAAQCKIAAAAGANAGQFGAAIGGIAVNPGNGQVLVADSTNRRVQRLSSAGAFVSTFAWDVIPTGKPGDTGTGLEACPASAANTAGNCQAGVAGTGSGQFSANQPGRIATDSGGSLYTVEATGGFRVQKFTPSGSSASGFASSQVDGVDSSSAPVDIATDPATDHVYVVKAYANGAGTPPATTSERRVLQFSNSGTLLDTHAALAGIDNVTGIAVASSTAAAGAGAIYLAYPGTPQRIFVLGAPNPPTAGQDPVTVFTSTTATFSGHVNPQGFTTGYHFEYRADASAGWTAFPTPDADAGAVGSDNPVTQAVTGLEPSTLYHVRLVATKANGGGVATTAETTFTTAGAAPVVRDTAVDSIQDHGARLVGFIDPQSQATSYHFEYGPADCAANPCASAPVPQGTVGSGSQALFVSQAITGLTAATTYHSRLVAENATGVTNGSDVTFTTRSAPLTVADRAYELVTPADKPGGQGIGQYAAVGDGQAAGGGSWPSINGDRVISKSLAGNLTPGGFEYPNDYAMSERQDDSVGWVSHSPFTHPEYSPNGGANLFFDPQTATPDLSTFGWGGTDVARARLFPEMALWPVNPATMWATSWDGRWELAAPTDPAISTSGAVGPVATVGMRISTDGKHLLFQPKSSGQLGATDGSLDQLASATLYEDDLSGGVSDQFARNGVRRLVGACTGTGAARTEIPNRDGAGKQGAQVCPDPLPGRDTKPISTRGASVGVGGNGQVATSKNVISADGSRIFFASPDPSASGSPTTCSGTGTATACPAQVYLNQRAAGGDPVVRWISRPTVANQDATLMTRALYEGATPDGSHVFFRTSSPLTADDRNGTGAAPVTTGTASATSWDLFRYDVPSGPDGGPSATDPGAGSLTRVSAGPTGDADCNVSTTGTGAALRFLSDDGTRAYFTCNAPLPGVATNTAPTDGTTTTAAGAVNNPTGGSINLYLYDSGKPLADRWEFIGLLPRTGAYASCATTTGEPGQTASINANFGSDLTAGAYNCFKGTPDGRFVTFSTPAQLVAGDPDATSADVYAYDADADKLIRIDAPQGGAGGTYGCASGKVVAPTGQCFGDQGYVTVGFSQLGVATKPADPRDRIVFFQSKSRLVPEDVNDQFDVYEWRNGKLSLLSTGTSDKGAYYSGNDVTGRDVFVMTRDRLSWQDIDAVMDLYDVRAGGGIPAPAPGTPECDVLGSECQPAAAPAAFVTQPAAPAAPGSAPAPEPKVSFSVGAVSPAAQTQLARTGKLTLSVQASGAGVVSARATATPGGRTTVVAKATSTLARAGTARLTLTLSSLARASLTRAHKLTVKVAVTHSRVAASQAVTLKLTRPVAKKTAKRSIKKKAKGSGRRATSSRKGARS